MGKIQKVYKIKGEIMEIVVTISIFFCLILLYICVVVLIFRVFIFSPGLCNRLHSY